MAEPINTVGNEGPLFVNERGTVMYLTQCKVEKKKKILDAGFLSQKLKENHLDANSITSA